MATLGTGLHEAVQIVGDQVPPVSPETCVCKVTYASSAFLLVGVRVGDL
jgi:hypothetical protein